MKKVDFLIKNLYYLKDGSNQQLFDIKNKYGIGPISALYFPEGGSLTYLRCEVESMENYFNSEKNPLYINKTKRYKEVAFPFFKPENEQKTSKILNYFLIY